MWLLLRSSADGTALHSQRNRPFGQGQGITKLVTHNVQSNQSVEWTLSPENSWDNVIQGLHLKKWVLAYRFWWPDIINSIIVDSNLYMKDAMLLF